MTSTKDIPENDRLKELKGNKNPFEVPKDYFDELPERMLDICKDSDKKNGVRHIIPIGLKYAAAAAILIALVWGANIIFNDKDSAPEDAYAGFSMQESYQYNLNHLAQLEEEYLLSILDEEEFEELITTDIDNTVISDEDIIDYLLSENHIEYHIANDY